VGGVFFSLFDQAFFVIGAFDDNRLKKGVSALLWGIFAAAHISLKASPAPI
jgi:hypothetical protein